MANLPLTGGGELVGVPARPERPNGEARATSPRDDGIRPVAGVRTRFPPGPRSAWKDVPDALWNDWHWQQRERVTRLDQLEKVIHLTADERRAVIESDAEFHMGITPYYAALMDPDDPSCPIRLQSVPTMGELTIAPADLEDPLAEERDMPVPGITHRYPDRVLFYTTHNCPVYCRHCTRKRKVSDPTSAAAKRQIEESLAYISAHPEIRDVVISGGDPLSLSDERLDYILGRLRAIPHVEIFRLGTRNLVTLPQRVTDDFVHMLRRHHPVYVNTHFNHPKECTAEAFEAARRLADAGCVIGNQMVLLKGVNDEPELVKELNHKLLLMRIRPYYIYQCDLAKGISHFRTPVETGIRIIEHLRGHTSGLAVPHFVVDAPQGGGKIPVNPNYVVSHEGKRWVLRNYAGKEYEYLEP
ncbi:lysine 2,3-aminomutase [Anaeromyxobacter sp. Fw109-5]|uniref:lysine 2,3-aminomutase n=1 Tax=Anaeromyxobacter sp. (strain Fw109-5) TaxID=404589 RepID=UPI0000ED7CF5|nr:lysine 2,3-aminomutase [Anaeromyxobacter sp. Fw109-5]ABS25523.1 lysine 2,3-aminomutase YodO family protein [Anaeromyxobacter sp. Fw109-5]